MSPISICLAGATGWAGSALARSIAASPDLRLVSAVGRRHGGRALGEVLGDERLRSVPIYSSAAEAVALGADVLVEYTTPDLAKHHVLTALDHGTHVVIGTSGLTEADFGEIEARARAAGRGVLACGNFSLSVVLLQRFAETAARYLPHWEIVDYATRDKLDAPSGTARELAHRLAALRKEDLADRARPDQAEPSRGAELEGTRVHSVRLPGYLLSTEVILGAPGQRLALRHDAGESAEPYVEGALIAIRRVGGLVGLHRGLDTVLEL